MLDPSLLRPIHAAVLKRFVAEKGAAVPTCISDPSTGWKTVFPSPTCNQGAVVFSPYSHSSLCVAVSARVTSDDCDSRKKSSPSQDVPSPSAENQTAPSVSRTTNDSS